LILSGKYNCAVSLLVPRYPVVLASASPRRKALLGRLFDSFEVANPDVDENSVTLPLEKRATELAAAKAQAVWALEAIVIAADTIVGLGDESLAKPEDEEDAKAMLRRLSGRAHRVITGVAVRWPDGETTFADVAELVFRDLTEQEIESYVSTGEPMDKAGAYAIQGGAADFAVSVEGDVDTVVGLPVAQLAWRLKALGLATPIE
jgi:septum formation protein